MASVNSRHFRGGDWDLLRVYLLGEMALCIMCTHLVRWFFLCINMFDRYQFQPCGGNNKMFRKKAHSFLLVWSRFGSQLMESLNDQKAPSLTSVNLVRLLLDEYILVAVESQLHEHSTQELMSSIQQYALPSPMAPAGRYTTHYLIFGSLNG